DLRRSRAKVRFGRMSAPETIGHPSHASENPRRSRLLWSHLGKVRSFRMNQKTPSARMHVATGLCRSEIGEPKPISLHDRADRDGDLGAELWAPETERVELTPLAAGIDASGQFCKAGNQVSHH